MRNRRRARFLFSLAWLGALGLAMRGGATAYGVTPEQLLSLLVTGYLGVWGLIFFLSRQGRTVDASRFGAVTGAILLAIAVFEVPAAMGLVNYRGIFMIPTPTWRRPGFRPDPELVYVREGNRRARWDCVGSELYSLRGASATTVYHCDLQLDRDGFRNPTGLDTPDVAIVGDSFVEGAHVGESELINVRLARLTGLSVANLGRTGYGPQQELVVLRRHALARKARTCVWAFYEGNDLQDIHEFESYQKDLPRILRSGGGESWYGRGFVRNALQYAIQTWLRPDPKRPAEKFTGRFVDQAGREISIYFGGGVQHGDGAPPLPREGSPELRLVRSWLAEANNLCRRQGAELIVVFIPSRFRVYRDACTFAADSPCRSWPVDDLPGALGAAVADLPGARFLDLTPRFRAEAAAGGLLYLADDSHWSARGHEAAAEELAAMLRPSARVAQAGPSPDVARR